MTLYNCSACHGVHDSAEPGCQSTIVHPIGIGNMHPDLIALVEFRDAVLEWMRTEDRVSLMMNLGPTLRDPEQYRIALDYMKRTYDRMLRLARRWDPLPNIPPKK